MRLLAVAAWLSAVPVLAQTGSQGARRDPEMEAPEVVKLELRGVRSFDEDEVRESIATEASSCNSALYRYTVCLVTKSRAVYTRRYLDREELARDVLRIQVFYWRRGYRDTEVDTLVRRRGENAVEVLFEVREGPPTIVGSVAIAGVDTLIRPRRLDELTLVDAGEPFSLLALDSSVVNLRDALWDLGYADAIIDTATAVDTASRSATVRITADPRWRATVGTVRVQGVEKLSEASVRNSMTLREGDVYRRDELFRSQRNLFESGLFRRVLIEPRGRDSVKALDVTVREADLQSVRLTAGFNTVDYAQVDGRYTHRNFLGGARRLTLQGTLGNLLARQLEDEFIFQRALPDDFAGDGDAFLRPSWLLSAEVRQPWFNSPHNTLAFSLFAHRRITPLVVVDRSQGATATFTRELAPQATASLAYSFETTRVVAGDVYFCTTFGVCDLTTIRTLRSTQRLSPLSLLGNVDRSDDPLSPSQGFRARLELEHASQATASDYRYSRGLVEGSAYRRMLGGVVAGRVRVGRTWPHGGGQVGIEVDPLLGSDVIHPRKRFYAGGARSVRGFGEGQLGPRILTIAPSVLRGQRVTEDGVVYDRCPPAVEITACPVNDLLDEQGDTLRLRADDFTARPLGSPALAEVSVEYRRAVWGPLSVAVFLDGAVLPAGDANFFTLDDNFMALTPGFGVRYQSPVGPIRVDVGIDPNVFKPADRRGEVLPVFTQVEGPDGELRIAQLGEGLPPEQRPLFRYDVIGDARGFRKVLNALVLHLSIGEAF